MASDPSPSDTHVMLPQMSVERAHGSAEEVGALVNVVHARVALRMPLEKSASTSLASRPYVQSAAVSRLMQLRASDSSFHAMSPVLIMHRSGYTFHGR